jgi:hypothetical protein
VPFSGHGCWTAWSLIVRRRRVRISEVLMLKMESEFSADTSGDRDKRVRALSAQRSKDEAEHLTADQKRHVTLRRPSPDPIRNRIVQR